MSQEPRLVLILGPTGCGKGEVGTRLSRTDPGHVAHLSAGDMIRGEISSNTALGVQMREYMEKGLFVPDGLMIDMIFNELRKPQYAGKCVLLDGFPRTPKQAKQLKATFAVDRVVLMQCPDEVCVTRVAFRRVDPVTQEVYNLQTKPPPDAEIEQRLVFRAEREAIPANVRRRIRSYHAYLARVIKPFRNKIFTVDSSQTIERVAESLSAVLQMPLPEQPPPQQDAAAAAAPAATSTTPAAPPPAATTTVRVVDRKGLCVCCMTEPADFLATPCGHQCCCEACFAQLQGTDARCPICRGRIQGVVRVFQSGLVAEEAEDAPGDTAAPLVSGGGAPFDEGEGHLDDDSSDEEEEDGASRRGDRQPRGAEGAAAAVGRDAAVDEGALLTIDVAPVEERHASQVSATMGVTIQVQDLDAVQSPVDICCVIDISGSMGEQAKSQDPNDNSKWIVSTMTQLDLVKHAVKTIIHTLSPNDRLSIVAFDDKGQVVFPLSEMTSDSRVTAVAALVLLEPDASTNIWAGLKEGLDSLRTAQASGEKRKCSVIFLTDGQPTVSPPQGEADCLKHYFELFPDFKCSVSTFGFGYSLKSKILLDIAREANGSFAFIPDASTLGTNFVNAVANARSCVILDAIVHLIPKAGATFADVPIVDNQLPWQRVDWGVVVHLGPMHAGQARDLVVNLLPRATAAAASPGEQLLDVIVEYATPSDPDPVKVRISHNGGHYHQAPTVDAQLAFARSRSVSELNKIIELCHTGKERQATEARERLQVLIGSLTPLELRLQDVRLNKLLEDLRGRVSKAISTTERWTRWGAHYLRAITRAHQFQVQANLMDPGLQAYGGKWFRTLVDAGGRVFCTLQMNSYPRANARHQPSHHSSAPSGARRSSATSAVPPTAPPPPPAPAAEDYYARSDCFAGHAVVESTKNRHLLVSEIRAGDELKMADGGWRTVTLVVEWITVGGRDDLVKLLPSGLVITPNHPVRLATNKPWVRPRDVDGALCKQSGGSVFNVVFDCHRGDEQQPSPPQLLRCGLLVNGVECVTYCHDIPELYHAFYATEELLRWMSPLPGFHDGYVRIEVDPSAHKQGDVIGPEGLLDSLSLRRRGN